jgi:hypothetical protein
VVCDRGTIDGIAYWPGPDDLMTEVGTTVAEHSAVWPAVIATLPALSPPNVTSPGGGVFALLARLDRGLAVFVREELLHGISGDDQALPRTVDHQECERLAAYRMRCYRVPSGGAIAHDATEIPRKPVIASTSLARHQQP